MDENALKRLFLVEVKDLYDAENQLIKALPKMARASTSEALRRAFQQHTEETKRHAQRLDQIFTALGEAAKGQKSKGMQGLMREGKKAIDADLEGEAIDATLISAAQRAEHYEIAGYGTARTYAALLGNTQWVALLQQTLDEEKETDHKLTEIARQIELRGAPTLEANPIDTAAEPPKGVKPPHFSEPAAATPGPIGIEAADADETEGRGKSAHA